MLFEIRDATPPVSQPWREARDLFLAGRARQARKLAERMRPDNNAHGEAARTALACANDYILNIEIARACSLNRTYLALARAALRAYPEDPIVQLYHSRALLTRRRHLLGIEFLRRCEKSLSAYNQALWAMEQANMYASAGFEASCQRWLAAADKLPGNDVPLALYARTCAHESLQQWDAAVEIARRTIAVAPDWSRARANLVHCLLARGRIEEAQQQIEEGRRRGHEEAILDITAAMLASATSDTAAARDALEATIDRWPDADFLPWAKRTLCILLVEAGDVEGARRIAGDEPEKLGLPEIPTELRRKHHLIPLPLVAQNRNQCVPVTVAMSAYPQGGRFDPDQLFREMRGREGTALWRVREWADGHGYRLLPVRLERGVIVELLDRNIPLIGVLEGTFNSHVEVICGYNDDLGVTYVRDPMHWATINYPDELALRRYDLHGGLLAVIDARRTEEIALAERYHAEPLAALLDLTRAVAQGERENADAAFARIADDSPQAFLRDTNSRCVAIAPSKYHQRMQALAKNTQAHPVARFRALMSAGSDEAFRELLELIDENEAESVGDGGRRFLTLMMRMQEGRWHEAQQLVERLQLTGGGMAQLWDMKSDILAELGDHDGSRQALDMAIELEPLRMSYREKALQRAATKLTLAEYMTQFDALLADDPDDKRLLWGRAMVLHDGPDGIAYERAMREYLHWFPRDPSGYLHLLNWYQLQERPDLVDKVLDQGRALLPDVFKPPTRDEATPAPSANGSPPAEAPLEMPTDKNDLLDLIWYSADARRPEALATLLALESSGELHWHERARLAACRLLIADDPSANTPPDPATLLPNPTPGAPHWFAGVVCDELTRRGAPIRVALAVLTWLERVVGDVTRYPDLWFNRVLLYEEAKQMERALADLQALVERHPAYSSALYRMGVVKFQQEDFPASKSYFERALEVNPGLCGAYMMLRRIYGVLRAAPAERVCIRKLREKFPYDFRYLRDEALATASLESQAAALALLDSVASVYPDRRLRVLRARIVFNGGNVGEASRQLERVTAAADEPDEGLYEEYLQMRMDLAFEQNNTGAILAVCDEGLRRWPNSTRLKEIQAERLADRDPERSRALIREVLLSGEPEARTAWQYLTLVHTPPHEAAREVVTSADADRRLFLAELFADVTGYSELLHAHQRFLEWAVREFPTAAKLQWQLAMHYNLVGRHDDAVRLARALHAAHPDDPEAVRTLGRCLIDRDPREAMRFLEQACEQDRSASYLFDLARCHTAAGQGRRATELHWEILDQNPYMAASWTNLFLVNESHDRLWPYLPPMLERGHGVDDEYFLVAAVKIAIALRQRLPHSWLAPAVDRAVVLGTRPSFRDEQWSLQRSIHAWLAKRPADRTLAARLPPPPLFSSWAARLFWPRCGWVPEA